MAKPLRKSRSTPKGWDIDQIAGDVVREAAAEESADIQMSPREPGKNPHAIALGRLGGRSRAKKLSAKRRAEIARKAARVRWRRTSP